MKYTVTTTENGFIEELEFKGKTYRMTWFETEYGFSSDDPEFSDQLAEDGVEDAQLLDVIWDVFDGSDIGSEMCKIEREFI